MNSNTLNTLRQNTAPLLILAHTEITVLERAKQDIQSGRGCSVFSIGKKLSSDLISGQIGNISSTQPWLIDQVRNLQPTPVLVVDIDLLFDPGFHLNPLSIFQQASRIANLIVLWPGSYSANKVLAYAVPEHHHYNTWRNPDAIILKIEE